VAGDPDPLTGFDEAKGKRGEREDRKEREGMGKHPPPQ